ncbi:MAG: hypothetical protein LAT55_12765 [Opitutales bacterium]|nr:hypothetical protein [Opitutales bacterium]
MADSTLSKLVGKRLSLAILISVIVHFVLLILLGLWTVYRYVQEGDPGMEVAMEQGEEMEAPQEIVEEVEVTEIQPEVEIDLDRLTVDPLHDVALPEIVAETQAVPTPPTPTVPTTVADRVAFTQATTRFTGGIFGSTEQVDGTLQGYLFDLKQDARGNSRRISNTIFEDHIASFIRDHDWDRSWLQKEFFQAPNSLNTSQIFFPTVRADAGPAYFGAGDIVDERQWIVHYEGRFQPQRSGNFRFVGYAGEVVIVRLNGEVVLDGSHPWLRTRSASPVYGEDQGQRSGRAMTEWQEGGEDDHGYDHKVFSGGRWGSHRFYYGDVMNFRQGQVMDLEILIGERGGGDFNAFLLIKEVGKEIEMDDDGRPIHDLFQTMPSDQHKSIEPYRSRQGPYFKVDGELFIPSESED